MGFPCGCPGGLKEWPPYGHGLLLASALKKKTVGPNRALPWLSSLWVVNQDFLQVSHFLWQLDPA